MQKILCKIWLKKLCFLSLQRNTDCTFNIKLSKVFHAYLEFLFTVIYFVRQRKYEMMYKTSFLILLGKLKEWSLVLYGTSIQPYSPRNDFPKVERVRSSPVEDPTEDYGTEDYSGAYINLVRAFTALRLCIYKMLDFVLSKYGHIL